MGPYLGGHCRHTQRELNKGIGNPTNLSLQWLCEYDKQSRPAIASTKEAITGKKLRTD